MTHQEALEIIAKAKPIVLPSSATSIDNKRRIITSFKDIVRNGKERRKMPKEKD